MTKKIGFIDLFIDEWHAQNYPAWFKKAPRASEFELGLAWEQYPNPSAGDLQAYCQKYGMTPAKSIEEVVAGSDAICVLAPSNPEVHEQLAEIPLKSGKPVFIDKPFAPDGKAAERMFQLATQYHTPLMSSSALRFSDDFRLLPKRSYLFAQTKGGGSSFAEYGVHQLEMLVAAMGADPVRVMQCAPYVDKMQILVQYPGDRTGVLLFHPDLGFEIRLLDDKLYSAAKEGNMFENMLAAVLDFFATRTPCIDPKETIAIAALLNAIQRASKTPGEWRPV